MTDTNRPWQPIETAPKDGSLLELTWMENGKPFEIWPCQWGHIQRNGFFPGKIGMWVAPDGGYTWSDSDPDGAPTHWRHAMPAKAAEVWTDWPAMAGADDKVDA